MSRLVLTAVVAVAIVTTADAAPIPVTVTGEVEFNQITDPPLGDVVPSDAVELTFLVDSDVFVDSASFPTRGYPIDPGSFSLVLGTVEVGLQDPFPAGQTPYFVLRDNDPAVDGFFVSTDIDVPIGVPLDAAGIEGFCDGRISRMKTPKDVEFIDRIPRNANGKVLKTELRKRG